VGGAAIGIIGIVLIAVVFSGALNGGGGFQSGGVPSVTPPELPDIRPQDTPEAVEPTEPPAVTEISSPTETPPPTEEAGPVVTPTGGGGMIAFASDRDGEPQIYLYDLDTGDFTQLTNIGGGACQPSWSPDGDWLAVVVPCSRNLQRYDGSSLFKVEVATGNHSPLPSSPIGDYDPDWSPVENKIVFTTVRDFDRPQVWVLDVDSGEVVNLSNNSQFDFQPTWSPDGSKIIFSSNRAINRGKLWIMDSNGQNVTEFSRNDARTNLEAVWAPDGDLVLYSQFDGSGGGVPRLMGNFWRDGGPQAGTLEFRISSESLGMREADISPDGHWIVFSANSNPDALDLYIMRINGAEMTGIVLDGSNDFDPAWSPLP
jgi:Tol biopolymer transport system component